ncbi:MAG: methionine aminotransferase [Cyclobacteriaceae bacterium]|jgi:methionine aminotransferase|nr:methionine aminotransferase [Cyclobacteriaceae bacterium]
MSFQPPKSKLPLVGTTIFTVMSKLAAEHGAINLSQGFPDFPLDGNLIELVNKAMQDGYNQYAPMPGWPALRQVISEVIEKTYTINVNPETEITVTAGGTQALFAIFQSLFTTGDEVIVLDPAYDSYRPAIELSGAKAISISLTPPDYLIDWNKVEPHITPNTKGIIINTPHNPTGSVFTEQDWLSLEKLALAHNLLVISDEVYERIIFDDLKHESVLSRKALRNQSVAVFSFGKTFHATGWKTGYVVASESLTKEIRKAHQFMVFSVHTPTQVALAAYMQNPEHYLSLGKFYQRKRDLFLQTIQGSSWQHSPCKGSYFQLLSYKNFSNEKDTTLAEEITIKHKVASIPVSVFYATGEDHKVLRFCFAKKDETLERAGSILKQF